MLVADWEEKIKKLARTQIWKKKFNMSHDYNVEECNLTDFLYKMKNHEKCKSHNLSLFFHYTTNSNSHIYKNFFLLKLVADWEKREKFIDWQIIIIINKCQWVSVFVCSLTPTKRRIQMSWNFEGSFPLGCRRF